MRPVIGLTADITEGSFVVRRAYADAVARAGGHPLVLIPPWPERCAYPAGEGVAESGHGEDAARLATMIDGLLIPGGGDIHPRRYGEEIAVSETLLKPLSEERLRFELAVLEAVIAGGKPVLAICYGMQLLNVCLGGTLYQDIGTQRPDSCDHSGGGHQIECELLCEGLHGSFRCRVNTSHHQAIRSLGRGLDVVARADDGIIEGIRLAGHPFVVGVQWHPELSTDALSARLFSELVSHARTGAAERTAAA